MIKFDFMVTERLQDQGIWPDRAIDTLLRFEIERMLTIRATWKLLAKFCQANISENATVLEIGSGTGFLRRNLTPDTGDLWVQMDGQPYFLDIAKNLSSQDTYICGSAYNVPFQDESFDVVCGFSSFDTFPDLNPTIRESHRVLKKGGLFFHMLDLLPSDEIMDQYVSQNGLKPPETPEEKHEYFSQRLVQVLETQFDNQPKVTNLSAAFVGRRTIIQQLRQEDRNPNNAMSSLFATYEGYDNKRKLLGLAFLAANRDLLFYFLQIVSPRLADKVGRTATEINTIRCITVRK
ncbi:MAG: class I SAM-dependent methyltransferase [bacterium]|nr:class I SAM-dependent methyltransferase [bacterium]